MSEQEKRIDTRGGYRIAVRGAGGGKTQKAATPTPAQQQEIYTPTEAPNTLRSRADAIVVALIGEGEIEGPASGNLLKDLYLDETPIQNNDGSLNFQNVIVDYRSGTQEQSYISGISSLVEAESSVNVQIKSKLGPVTRTINNPEINAVRVRLMVPSLVFQNEKGDVLGSEVDFRIELATQGGPFVEVIRDKIAGKTTSAYERSYRFSVATSGPWDVRITRLTPDSDKGTLQNDLYWQSYVEIVDAKFRYPNSALVAIRISAEQFQSIPRIALRAKLLKIKVPHNYDPVARTYSGIFNGSLVRRYSNNPAWVLYDIVTNTRYGCGKYINPQQVEIYSLYSIAQYCDELVPDGKGGMEPRFTCNCYIQSRDDAVKILEAITSCFRGMVYAHSDSIVAIQDRPKLPARGYTKANVVHEYDEEGKLTSPPFTYSGTALETRYTVALVTWSDPNDFYRTKVEVYEDIKAIARYGYNPTEVVAFGCTSQSQAHRAGKWMVLSERELSQTVTFKVGAEGLLVVPGEVFKVLDQMKTAERRGGRIVSATPSTVRLDDPVTLESGNSYGLSIVRGDGRIETRTVVTPPGTHSELSVESPYSYTPLHIWLLESHDLRAQLFQCVAVTEIDVHLYEITGIEYNDSIYRAVESDFQIEELPISGIPDPRLPIESPKNFYVNETLYQFLNSLKLRIDIYWKAPESPYIKDYQVEYKVVSDPEYKFIETTSNLSTTLFDILPGLYIFRVRANNYYGKSSPYVYYQKEIYGLSNPPRDVTGFTSTVSQNTALLAWSLNPELDVLAGGHYKIKYTPKTEQFNWSDGIEVATIGGSTNRAQVPLLDGTYMIKAVDVVGNQSINFRSTQIIGTAQFTNYNAVASLYESPSFPGVHDDTVAIGGKLRLISLDYFDAQPGLFDDMPGLFDDVQGYFDSQPGLFDDMPGLFDDAGINFSVVKNGTYEFSAPIDLGEVYTSRVTADFSAYVVDESSYFDSRPGLFDDATGLFDGEGLDVGYALLQIKTSQDGLTYSDWQNFIVGDYTARAFNFRVLLEGGGGSYNVYVERLGITVDMPDRVVASAFRSFSSQDTVITFDGAFSNIPEIAITINNSQSGDYLELVDKTNANFTVNVRDQNGDRVTRNISYIAKGYGRKLTKA